jgi:hypothetical protein
MKPPPIRHRRIAHKFNHPRFTGTLRLIGAFLVLAMGSFVTTGCATTGTGANLASSDPASGYYQSNDNPFREN